LRPSVTSDVRAVLVEVNVVAAGQRDQLGDPQPGLAGQQQQGVVAVAEPGGEVEFMCSVTSSGWWFSCTDAGYSVARQW
jgi:hypothetical protein